MRKYCISVFFTSILILAASIIAVIPWWSYVLPVFIVGITLSRLNWNIPGFWLGFVSGFCTWLAAYIFYGILYNGIILGKLAELLAIPQFVIILLACTVNGIVSGLALYSGYVVFDSQIKKQDFDIQDY
jgi:hypothetical protein